MAIISIPLTDPIYAPKLRNEWGGHGRIDLDARDFVTTSEVFGVGGAVVR
jgi:hypothetical protein